MPEANADEIIDGVFRSIARLLVVFSRFPDLNKENISEWIEYSGREHYLEAKRRGRGVLFATAHLGAWELSAFAHALMSEPMCIVVRPLDNMAVDAIVEERRQMSGNRIVTKREAARTILRALAANQAVGILVDQNSSLQEGVFVPFLGLTASANSTFVKLAHRTGAAVIPGFALWHEERRKFILHFDPILEMSGDVIEDTARVQRTIERFVRQYPDQWLWIHRRWKTQPPGTPSFY
jgi:KDO2-lipid IV(A) lauroyltransferase